MKLIFIILLALSTAFCEAQISNVASELKSLSKELKTSKPTEDGKYIESTDFEIIKDTLYIYQSKGFPEIEAIDEYHYFIKLSDLANVEYNEMTLGDYTSYMVNFTSKGKKPKFIFKYGTKEEITQSLKNDPLSDEEIQSYTVITLPELNDKSKYKKLESLLKSLIK